MTQPQVANAAECHDFRFTLCPLRGTQKKMGSGMEPRDALTFTHFRLDRAAYLRSDAERLDGLIETGGDCVLPMWRGKALLGPGPDGDLVPGLLPANSPVFEGAGPPIFLGLDDGAARFVRDMSRWEPPADDLAEVGRFFDPSQQRHPAAPDHAFTDLRANLARLALAGNELLATAKALTGWHATHGFCARCGTASVVSMAGWQRDCPDCGTRHFPRVDPVVIVLVTHGNDLLLGRSPGWPEGMYSLLAGFMEPGETPEAAARREIFEESAIRIGPVSLLSAQPWPFPASLMLGCRAEAQSRDIQVDPAELDDARWISREDMVAVFAGTHPAMFAPRKGSIARHIIGAWLEGRL